MVEQNNLEHPDWPDVEPGDPIASPGKWCQVYLGPSPANINLPTYDTGGIYGAVAEFYANGDNKKFNERNVSLTVGTNYNTDKLVRNGGGYEAELAVNFELQAHGMRGLNATVDPTGLSDVENSRVIVKVLAIFEPKTQAQMQPS